MLLGLVLYAGWVEPRWIEVTRTLISRSGSSRVVAVQLSDLHLSEIGARERRILEVVGQLSPDLVILSGDVIDRPETLPVLTQFLRQLAGRHKFAVLGNWEYWSDLDLPSLQQLYKAHSVNLLVNEAAVVQVGGTRVGIIGLDDYTAGQPSAPSLPKVDISIWVQHSPGYFDTASQLPRADLCLSGHTHGGQLTLFGQAIWRPPGSGRFVGGWYDLPQCHLFVSRGLGTSLLDARLGARPEVAVFDL